MTLNNARVKNLQCGDYKLPVCLLEVSDVLGKLGEVFLGLRGDSLGHVAEFLLEHAGRSGSTEAFQTAGLAEATNHAVEEDREAAGESEHRSPGHNHLVTVSLLLLEEESRADHGDDAHGLAFGTEEFGGLVFQEHVGTVRDEREVRVLAGGGIVAHDVGALAASLRGFVAIFAGERVHHLAGNR